MWLHSICCFLKSYPSSKRLIIMRYIMLYTLQNSFQNITIFKQCANPTVFVASSQLPLYTVDKYLRLVSQPQIFTVLHPTINSQKWVNLSIPSLLNGRTCPVHPRWNDTLSFCPPQILSVTYIHRSLSLSFSSLWDRESQDNHKQAQKPQVSSTTQLQLSRKEGCSLKLKGKTLSHLRNGILIPSLWKMLIIEIMSLPFLNFKALKGKICHTTVCLHGWLVYTPLPVLTSSSDPQFHLSFTF